MKTLIKRSLKSDSDLVGHVNDGIGALIPADQARLHRDVKGLFEDSLDLDSATRDGAEGENRWDYILGYSPSGDLVGIEPHSAKEDQIAVVIRKKQSSKDRLADHLKDGKKIGRWLWVSSGRVQFLSMERASFRLSQSGIDFVGGMVLSKHLPQVALGNSPVVKKQPRKGTSRNSRKRKVGR